MIQAAQAAVVVRNPKRYWVFLTVAMALFMTSVDNTSEAVALRNLSTSLDTSVLLAGWALTAYQLMQAVAMPIAGSLSGVFGPRRVFMGGVILFSIGALLSSIAPNIWFLIIFRFFEGLGGGAVLPSAAGIVGEEFKEERAKYIGLFTSIFPIGGLLGPNLGGLLLQFGSWRYIFIINTPVGAALLVMAFIFLRGKPAPSGKRISIDYLGAAFFGASLLCALTGLTFLGHNLQDWSAPYIWVLFGGSVSFMVAFIRQEMRAASPLLDLRLLSYWRFVIINFHNFLLGMMAFGTFAFYPLYAHYVYNFSDLLSGFSITPRAAAVITASAITSLFLFRYGYRILIAGGTVILALAFLFLGRGYHDPSLAGWVVPDLALVSFGSALTGLGLGIVAPSSNNAGLELMPDKVAAIVGLRGMFRSIGSVIGTTIMLVVLAASPTEAAGLKFMFTVYGIVMLVLLPLVFGLPNRGAKPLGKGK